MEPDRESLEQQLWELLYDLLPDEEAVALRRRIAEEPEVAESHARVLRQRNLIAQALKWDGAAASFEAANQHIGEGRSSMTGAIDRDRADDDAAVHSEIETPSPASPAVRSPLFRAVRIINVLAAVAAAVLLAVAAYTWSPSAESRFLAGRDSTPSEQGPLRLVVAGPQQLVSQSGAAFTVSATTLGGVPQRTEIRWRVKATDGEKTLASGREITGEDGLALIAPPLDEFAGAAEIEVESASNPDTPHLAARFVAAPAVHDTRLLLDKTHYAPGETVRIRSLTLSQFGHEPPPPTQVSFQLNDPAGNPLSALSFEAVTDHGVATGAVALPSDLPEGTYSIVAHPEEATFAAGQEFFVGRSPHSIASARTLSLQASQLGRKPNTGDADELSRASEESEFRLEVAESVVPAGEPLRVQLATRRPDAPLVVAVCKDLAVVGHMPVIFPAAKGGERPVTATVDVPIAENAAGELDVLLYDYSAAPPQVVAQGSVYREPAKFLRVGIQPSLERSDGGTTQLQITTTDEDGAPVQALLGVSVRDEPFDRPTDRTPLRLARKQLLFESVASGLRVSEQKSDIDFFANAPEESDTAFARRYLGRKRANESQMNQGVRAFPLLVDNGPQAREVATTEAAQRLHRRGDGVFLVGRLSLIGGAAVVVVLLLTALLRDGFDPRIWTPTLAGSLLLVGVGVSWISGDRRRPEAPALVAFHSVQPRVDSITRDEDNEAVGRSFAEYAKDRAERLGAEYADLARRGSEPVIELDVGNGPEPGAAGASMMESRQRVAPLLAKRSAPSREVLGETELQRRIDSGKDAAEQEADFGLPESPVADAGARALSRLADAGVRPEAAAAGPAPETFQYRYATPPGQSDRDQVLQDRLSAGQSPGTNEAAYWRPSLRTDENGRATISLPLPKPSVVYRVVVDAHSPGRVGRAEQVIQLPPP